MTNNPNADNRTEYIAALDTQRLSYALHNTGYSARLTDRPLVSEQNRDITVGTDTDTIQEALNEIPLLLRHNFIIRIPDGTYDEHLLVPPFTLADTAGVDNAGAGADEGATQNPWIRGNQTTPTNVSVNSITVTGTTGAIAPIIEGLNPTGDTPYDDESVGVAAFGCQNVSFRYMSFAGSTATRGFLPYASGMTIRDNVDLGSGDLDIGIETKHNSNVNIDTNKETASLTGSVNTYVIDNRDGCVVTFSGATATAGSQFINSPEGPAFDADTQQYVTDRVSTRVLGSGSDQTVSSNTVTTVEFDTTDYDFGGNYDTTTYTYTTPMAGVYHINYQVQFIGPSDTTQLDARIDITGESNPATQINGVVAANPVLSVCDTQNLASGTDISFLVNHDEGASLDINTDNNTLTFASIHRENGYQ